MDRHISQYEIEKIEQRDIKLPTNHNFKQPKHVL